MKNCFALKTAGASSRLPTGSTFRYAAGTTSFARQSSVMYLLNRKYLRSGYHSTRWP
jgi:hypothetical protein